MAFKKPHKKRFFDFLNRYDIIKIKLIIKI